MISIIVPIYNAEKYLHKCLDSVLSQTYTDWECILIDDGSPDNSGSICDEYVAKDSRFRVLHKENGGVSSARNIGLEIANGEWIAFVDADDKLMPNFLENFCIQGEDFYIAGYKNFGENENIVVPSKTNRIYNEFNVGDSLKDIVLVPSILAPWGKIYKRCIIKDNDLRFPIGMRNAEDIHFVLEYFTYCHSVKVLSNVDYRYFCANECSGKKYQMNANDYQFHINKILNQISVTEKKMKIMLPELRQKLKSRFWNFFRTWLENQSRLDKVYGISQYTFNRLYKYNNIRDVMSLYYMALFPGIYKIMHKGQ